jgi:uncharacterized membrane protein YhaH (DUF805 family)
MENFSPIGWALRPLKNYTNFGGRAPRAEYWWYTLALIISLGLGKLVDFSLGLKNVLGIYGPVSSLVLLATIIASLAVQTRRLHDVNRSGLWLILIYVPEAAIFAMARYRMSAFNAANPTPQGFLVLVGILGLVVLVASVVLLIAFAMRGTPGPNRYGPDPYGPTNLEEVFA